LARLTCFQPSGNIMSAAVASRASRASSITNINKTTAQAVQCTKDNAQTAKQRLQQAKEEAEKRRKYEDWPKPPTPPPVPEALTLLLTDDILRLFPKAQFHHMLTAGVVRHTMSMWGVPEPDDIKAAEHSMAVLLKLPPEQPPPAAVKATAPQLKQQASSPAAAVGAAPAPAPATVKRHAEQQKQQPQQLGRPAEKKAGASFSKHPSITPETLQYALPQHYFSSPQQQLLATAAQELHELLIGRGLRCPTDDTSRPQPVSSTAEGESLLWALCTTRFGHIMIFHKGTAPQWLHFKAFKPFKSAVRCCPASCVCRIECAYSAHLMVLCSSTGFPWHAVLATSGSNAPTNVLCKFRKGFNTLAAALRLKPTPPAHTHSSIREAPSSTAMFAATLSCNPQQPASSVASLQRRLQQEVWSMSMPSDQYLLCRSTDGIDSPVRFRPVRCSASKSSALAQKQAQHRAQVLQQQQQLRAQRAASVQMELQGARSVLSRAIAAAAGAQQAQCGL
jgi:hypothetical protein